MNLQIPGPVQPAQVLVLIPALAAVVLFLATRLSSRASATITLLASVLMLAAGGLVLAQQIQDPAARSYETFGALPAGSALRMPLQLVVHEWNALLALGLAVIATAAQAFARWYLWTDPRYRRFAAVLSLLTAAMLLVVLSGDLLVTVAGWELLGWCSFLLIGHERRRRAGDAARQAFWITRIAGVPLLLGVIILAVGAGSTGYAEVIAHWQQAPNDATAAFAVAMLGVVVGVLATSAQFPFQSWLPDAMEAPIPAAAVIGGATTVSAGAVLLAALHPLLAAADLARAVLIACAGVSAIGGALLALAQSDFKRLLAWSSISQTGVLLCALAAVSPDSPAVATLLILGHAAVTALLFLMSGWAAVLVGSTQSRRMAGLIRRHPGTRRGFAIGLLALAGVPPLAGFIGQAVVLDRAAPAAVDGDSTSLAAVAVLAVTTVATAGYAMRMWLVIQHRTVFQRRSDDTLEWDSRSVEDVNIVDLLREAPQVDPSGHVVEPEIDEPAPEPAPTAAGRLGIFALSLIALAGGALAWTPLVDLPVRHLNLMLAGAIILLMIAAALMVRIASLGTVYGDAAERIGRRLGSAADRGLGWDRGLQALVRPYPVLAAAVSGLGKSLVGRLRPLTQGPHRVAVLLNRQHGESAWAAGVSVIVSVVVVVAAGVLLW
ncbi:proton-conducting transporter membrane subunit [Dermacoccaceae bacterium W4C1]